MDSVCLPNDTIKVGVHEPFYMQIISTYLIGVFIVTMKAQSECPRVCGWSRWILGPNHGYGNLGDWVNDKVKLGLLAIVP